jgi:hypothetical protein
MKLGILNEFNNKHDSYIKACNDLNIEYCVVDIISDNWIDNIRKSKCDGYLVRPSDGKEAWKRMYDEKLYFIEKVLKIPIYPSYIEIFIYENKKNMSYWLDINMLPHPKTWVFYSKDEALQFVNNYKQFPLVFKTNLGSAAIGVKYINKKSHAIKLINRVFPKFRFYCRGYTKWRKTRYGVSYPVMDDKQYSYIIFQEKIDVKVEWRIIKIGESYFGHQKLSDGKYHSGSGLVGWVEPPRELLDLAKKVCELGSFGSMDFDIFEDTKGNYYINEMQTVFGSYNPSQMYINGRPGRFVEKNGEWVFEEGYFNQNRSYNLRVEDFVKQMEKRQRA